MTSSHTSVAPSTSAIATRSFHETAIRSQASLPPCSACTIIFRLGSIVSLLLPSTCVAYCLRVLTPRSRIAFRQPLSRSHRNHLQLLYCSQNLISFVTIPYHRSLSRRYRCVTALACYLRLFQVTLLRALFGLRSPSAPSPLLVRVHKRTFFFLFFECICACVLLMLNLPRVCDDTSTTPPTQAIPTSAPSMHTLTEYLNTRVVRCSQ